jgi:hypothetical protein
VRALLTDGEDPAQLTIADQSGGIRERLGRLPGLAGWKTALAGASVPDSPHQARAWLAGLADAAATRYLQYGHGNVVMLVHPATAPTAVLRTLPALSEGLWALPRKCSPVPWTTATSM